MITTTANASVSKAIRNAIFRAIPRAYVSAVEAEARRVAVGDQRTLAETRDKWIQWFSKLGISEARVLAMLEKPSLADVDMSDLETLTGVSTAIREGHAKVDDIFPPEELADGVGSFKKGAAAKPAPNGKAETKTNGKAADAKATGKKRGRKPKLPGLVPQINKIEQADTATLDEIASVDDRKEITAAIERRRAELAKDAFAGNQDGDQRVDANGVAQVYRNGQWVDAQPDEVDVDEPPAPNDNDAPQGGFGFGS
jgi:hypothetical protein